VEATRNYSEVPGLEPGPLCAWVKCTGRNTNASQCTEISSRLLDRGQSRELGFYLGWSRHIW